MAKIKSSGKVRRNPVRLGDGSILFRVGICADAQFSGILVCHESHERMGMDAGAYFEVENEERGAVITRRLGCADCEGYSALHGDYVYLDPVSAQCLGAEVHDSVRLRPALFDFDMP